MPEMVMPTLEVRYSVLNLISRIALCVGFALFFLFAASQLKPKSWFTTISYTIAAAFTGAAVAPLNRLLTARNQVVVSINAAGFRDTRLTSTLIPWSAIRSVSPYIPYKSRTATGVSVAVDPAFERSLPIRLDAKLFGWANLSFGANFIVDLGPLDVDVDEVSRVAKSYISKRT
jgi:hypothetical protein